MWAGTGAGPVPLRVQPQEEMAKEGASIRDLESRQLLERQ